MRLCDRLALAIGICASRKDGETMIARWLLELGAALVAWMLAEWIYERR
jgi:hypothetical protein